MNLLTRDTDYAIRSLCYIAKNSKRIVSVTELVSNLKIPRPFLRKILQELNKKGVLESFKGKGGGFRLGTSAKKIFIVDVVGCFQGPIKMQEHLFKKGLCPNIKTCVLKKRLDIIEKRMIAELDRVSIASLINDI